MSQRPYFLCEGTFLTNMNMCQLIFLNLALLCSKMALWSWAVYNIKTALSKQKCLWLYTVLQCLVYLSWLGITEYSYNFQKSLVPPILMHIIIIFRRDLPSLRSDFYDVSSWFRKLERYKMFNFHYDSGLEFICHKTIK